MKQGAIPSSRGMLVPQGVAATDTEETLLGTLWPGPGVGSYQELPTPDQVPGVVLPTNGLIGIGYKAIARGSAALRAAIHLDGVQLKVRGGTSNFPVTTAACLPADGGHGSAGSGFGIMSCAGGLVTQGDETGVSGDVGTGQALASFGQEATSLQNLGIEINGTVYKLASIGGGDSDTVVMAGGLCWVFADAGTYDVSVRYKNVTSAGDIRVKNRRLWVMTAEYPAVP